MTPNNKAVLEQANAAVLQGDNEGFLSFCTEDTVWHFLGDQTLQGKDAVRQYISKAYLEPPKFVVDHLIAEGDFVTAVGKISLKDDHGVMIDYDYCDVWRFRDGQLAELKAFVIQRKD